MYIQITFTLKASGRLKVAEAGIGWKNSTSGQIITVSATDIHKMHWVRVAREYELKIIKSDGNTVRFDGFQKDVSEFENPFKILVF